MNPTPGVALYWISEIQLSCPRCSLIKIITVTSHYSAHYMHRLALWTLGSFSLHLVCFLTRYKGVHFLWLLRDIVTSLVIILSHKPQWHGKNLAINFLLHFYYVIVALVVVTQNAQRFQRILNQSFCKYSKYWIPTNVNIFEIACTNVGKSLRKYLWWPTTEQTPWTLPDHFGYICTKVRKHNCL